MIMLYEFFMIVFLKKLKILNDISHIWEYVFIAPLNYLNCIPWGTFIIIHQFISCIYFLQYKP